MPVSRHELSRATPTLLTALAYEAVFRVPVAELFPGAMNAVRLSVEDRIRAFKKELENSALRGRKAIPIAQKLVWTSERELGE